MRESYLCGLRTMPSGVNKCQGCGGRLNTASFLPLPSPVSALLVVPHGVLDALSTVAVIVYIPLNAGRLAYAKIRVTVYFSLRS